MLDEVFFGIGLGGEIGGTIMNAYAAQTQASLERSYAKFNAAAKRREAEETLYTASQAAYLRRREVRQELATQRVNAAARGVASAPMQLEARAIEDAAWDIAVIERDARSKAQVSMRQAKQYDKLAKYHKYMGRSSMAAELVSGGGRIAKSIYSFYS
jgi:hypothetical protein